MSFKDKNNLTLLVMAAGMGSRYGGLKQLDQIGPSGETIIDYSVYDAIEAGFNKIIFIIREVFEEQFKTQVADKYLNKIEVEFAYQDINDLPSGFSCPDGREKPWGTGHAILSANHLVHEPFVVINGDDYYGKESFKVISDYYFRGKEQFCMVGFRLENTLSSFGAVTRGVCSVENKKLSSVVETGDLQKKGNIIYSDRDISFDGNEPVSMNMWGFTPVLFHHLKEKFIDFLNVHGREVKSEFLIPSIINELIQDGDEKVHVLETSSSWFGVTYKSDKPIVEKKIQQLVSSGVYPSPLF
ncbi:MAG: sugar phosphate nucleotidyltransferase [Candidatus Neomarinimicrobiota bacterium]|jgi:dTDP-glucose pyrophosphorylase|nr:sugar phosphate nucleotidyltransferase [Candidatus Neomarinimicrobiota bacterium]|tara:strand:+ start:1269 stop:2165 length:897 start_codon:yes stop_codon:yes gene_type:complete